MLKNVLNTLFTKILYNILSFVLVILQSQYLGAQGFGTISLVLASTGILGLLNGLVGGTSLVYLFPQYRNKTFLKKIEIISALWTVVVCLAGTVVMAFIGTFPKGYFYFVFIIGILTSLPATGSLILLADGKISEYNLISLLQAGLNLIFFSIILFVFRFVNVESYLYSIIITNVFTILIMGVFLSKIRRGTPRGEDTSETISTKMVIVNVVKFGFIAQLGNIIQYLNYRLSYFFLEHSIGTKAVGQYAIGVRLSEAIWMISGSIALILYSKVANTKDEEKSRALTIRLSKVSLTITFICILLLILIPKDLISYIFGKDFTQVGKVILSLSIGVVSFGFSSSLSNYFAGTGRYYINTISAAAGLVITVLGGIFLIPAFGFVGAGLTASLSYFLITVFLLIAFKKVNSVKISRFIPNRDDLAFIIETIKSFMPAKSRA